jgi:uncharacterized protein
MTRRARLPGDWARVLREDLHVFARLGGVFAVHRPSGEFFALDDVARFAVETLAQAPFAEARAAIEARFGKTRAKEVIADLRGMAEAGGDAPAGPSGAVEMTDLTLNVVNGCNLACVYCWNERGSYGGRVAEDGGARMTAGVARKAVDLLLAAAGEPEGLVVDFYGGEPLLNFPVMRETVAYCGEIARARGVRFSFLLATNGLLLSPEVAAWLRDSGVNVALSLDGDQPVQDAQRPLPGGGGSFDRIWKNLAAVPVPVRADYVARATLTPVGPGPMGTYERLHKLGFRRIEVFESEAACFGLPREHADRFFLRAEDRARLMNDYEVLVAHLLDRVAAGDLEYRDLFFTRIFKQMARLVRNGDFEGPCAAGLGQMAVDAAGHVYPCTAFIGQPEWRMGHVDRGLDAAVQDRLRACDILASSDCAACWARKLCLGSGSCFNLNHFNHGDIGRPVPEHCEMYRFKIELLVAALARLQGKSPERFEALFEEGHFEDRTAWSPGSAR